MEPQFWHNRWHSGQIGFHQVSVDGSLLRHWQDLALPRSSRVFVPLCGKSLDLLWLGNQGHAVTGVELSDFALQAFCVENGVPTRRRLALPFDIYESANLQLFGGDFFALTSAILGNVAAVYDRAALISWAPELRVRYVEHLTAITLPGTETLLVTVEYPQAQAPGPPFSLNGGEIRRLYSGRYSIRELDRRDILDSEPRMRARGISSLTEVCYRLTRL